MKAKNNTLPKSAGLKEILLNDLTYAEDYKTAVHCAVNLTAGELCVKYKGEYNSWRNRKKYAKDHKIPWFHAMNEFSDFLVINGQIPHLQWTLDRINPKGGYLPENIRWASKATQSQNRTNARSVEIDGELLTFNEISAKTGKSYDSIRMGVKRHGDSYIQKLIVNPPTTADIWNDVMQWKFPSDSSTALEKLYIQRRDAKMFKPRFFVELVAFELKTRIDLLKSNPSIEVVKEAESDIASLTPLLQQTQTFIDNINRRIWQQNQEKKSVNMWSGSNLPQLPACDWDADYYLKVFTDDYPWATYPKQVDPVYHLFPGFGI